MDDGAPTATDTPNEAIAGDDDPIGAYKILLRRLIERRPSGTRQKLAAAIGAHKSFVSQITNPAYRVPLPAQHVPTVLRVCRVSAEERRAFLELYARAHPGAAPAHDEDADDADALHIALPRLADQKLRADLEAAIRDLADRLIALARRADRPTD